MRNPSGALKQTVQTYIPALLMSLSLTGFIMADDLHKGHKSAVFPGSLVGEVREADERENVGWAVLLLDEIDRSISAHEDGAFHFYEVPPGTYTLKVFRIGYEDYATRVQVFPDSVTRKVIFLRHNRLSTEAVVVEADPLKDTPEPEKPRIDISGKKLRQNLGRTIAETIEHEPGLAQRTMGPAPARPVMRGMSGDRLLIVEDGEQIGDLSATSADHAVAIEPMTTERIEVIRGPSALKYGSNSMGGVINVVRDYVPTARPHRFSGSASLQGETVNSSRSGGAGMQLPLGAFAVRADGSFRKANDISTPEGKLPNTGIRTSNGSAGLSFVRPKGYMGIAGSFYNSEYGIPPDYFGGHPGGVDIDLKRRHLEAQAAYYPDRLAVRRIQFHYNVSRYYHAEYESNGDLGMDYGLVSHYFKAFMNLCWLRFLRNCEYGFWGGYRDFATGGFSFTPDTRERKLAGYFYTEFSLASAAFNLIVRFDDQEISPDRRKQSPAVGLIRMRKFNGFSGGVSARYPVSRYLKAGAAVLRTFRAPQIEELFSEGPHLAAYSYEIGNADLESESGTGLEALLKLETEPGSAQFTIFRNDIGNYIYPANTGRRSYYRDDLFVYRYVGLNAVLQGAEFSFDWNLRDAWSVKGDMSYVNGELGKSGEPLPYIPPFSQKMSLVYRTHHVTLTGAVRSAFKQNRLGENENLVPDVNPDGSIRLDDQGDVVFTSRPTAGYFVFDFHLDYFLRTGSFLSTINLGIENVGDRVYRKHLNRVKEVLPEPGRNIKLLYKIYF